MIALVISIAVFLFGIYTVNLGNKGPGDIEAVSGELTMLEGACDKDFEIYVDSPVLIRKVEMYQYVQDKDKEDVVTTDFSDRHEPMQETDKGTLKNPDFPDDIKSKIFYGKVQIGESGLDLSDEILEKLSYKGYINLENPPKKIPVGGLADGRSYLGLKPLDDYTYCTPGGEYFEVGDLRVTWYAVDTSALTGIYTAVGSVKDGVIGDDENIIDLYDKEISFEEVVDSYKGGNETFGIALVVIGLILILICILPLFKKKKLTEKVKSEEKED